jgi:hypothetical protein
LVVLLIPSLKIKAYQHTAPAIRVNTRLRQAMGERNCSPSDLPGAEARPNRPAKVTHFVVIPIAIVAANRTLAADFLSGT